jgi:hypothetical protein
VFFFEKKNQKLLKLKRSPPASVYANGQKFLLLFSKRSAFFLRSEFRHLISATRPMFHNQFIAPVRYAVPPPVRAML